MNIKLKYLIIIVLILFLLQYISVEVFHGISNKKTNYNFGKLEVIQKDYDSTKEYYNYNQEKLDKYKNRQFDEQGVLLTEIDDELIYNPSDIAIYGLMLFSKYIETNDIKYYNNSKVQADYLVKIQKKDDGSFIHLFEKRVSGTPYTLTEPWISASCQGIVLSLLCRIYSESNDDIYIKACELALEPFSKSVQDGGVNANLFGYSFYEMYPTEKPNYVLSGHLYSLIGINDYYSITGDEKAKKLYNDGIATLEYILPFYDYDGISLYNLNFIENYNYSKCYFEVYHIQCISQLQIINEKENNEVIEFFIKKWIKYVKN